MVVSNERRNMPMCKTRAYMGCALVVAFGLAGCTIRTSQIAVYDNYGDRDVDLIQTAYNAIDHLLEQTARVDPARPILVATVVNLDDVEDTSTFGRLTGQFLASRLAHHGFAVVHTTVRQGSVVIKQEGEFLLSRDVQELAADYNAAAVLVSTYTLGLDNVYLSVKLVNAPGSQVVAAVDYAIPKGPRTRSMLGLPPDSGSGNVHAADVHTFGDDWERVK